MAPSTPPPPIRLELAAFTIASVACVVMSAGPHISTSFSGSPTKRNLNSCTVPSLAGTCVPTQRRVGSCEIAARSYLLLRQRFHAGQYFAFEKLKRRAAASRNVRNLVRDSGCLYGGNGITPAHNRSCSRVLGHSPRDLKCTLGKLRNLKDAHRPVPHDRGRPADFFRKKFDRL